ncbi:MAG: protein-L-isoaspartate(D-aspartate) O-methyltransferase [Melioribacteraceae bacterium]
MFEIERAELVNLLRSKGIKDEAVLSAINKIERHNFIEPILIPKAYLDVALPIGQGQTISQPYTVAVMTESLKLKRKSKVLEIGTGSGYQAAILHQMGMKVFSIERNENIYRKTQKFFDDNEIRVHARCSDGTIGWGDFAPYDAIIVTAGGPFVPKNLKKQLALGGRIVIPVGDMKKQSLLVLHKIDENIFETTEVPNFKFVPLIGKEGW